MSRRLLTLLAAGVLCAAFLLGIARLFILRFEAGDVYPPYSSLRADPLGTKALHDALGQMPGYEVERLYRPLDPMSGAEGQTLFVIGIRPRMSAMRDDLRDIKRYAVGGSRVVLMFRPVKAEKHEEPKEEENDEAAGKKGDTEEDEDGLIGPLAQLLEEELGVSLAYGELPEGLTAQAHSDGLEPELSWHTALYFENLADDWEPIYSADGQAAVIERKYGAGSIVLAADSFAASNEALRGERAPAYLAWLAGSHRRVIFDETLHGVREHLSLMGLMRRYNLTPVLGVFLLLAGLFAWRNMRPLVPRRPTDGAGEPPMVTGRDAALGRINLLRRSISIRRLSETCVEIWERSFGHRMKERPQVSKAVHEAVESEKTAPVRRRNPLATYGRIAAALEEKR